MQKKLLLIMLLLGMISCSSRTNQSNKVDKQKISARGEKTAMALLKSLKSELQKAIKEGGPAKAVEICSIKVLPLTEKIDAELGATAVKRTTFQYRNKRNAPDLLEQKALNYFEKQLTEKGVLPSHYLQEVKGQKAEYRYYKPLKIQALCLQCHGKKEIPQEVVQVLEQKYPEDKATGYRLDQFRGVIRITLPAQ